MANLSDFLPAAGGSGGGGIPKYEEFTSSGTFTPSQALIDAGGRIGLFIVGAGQSGPTGLSESIGGGGGEVKMVYTTLTNTNSVTVTIGASSGGSTTFAGSSAGGDDVVALGGTGRVSSNNRGSLHDNRLSSGFGSSMYYNSGSGHSSAGSGFLGYGVGGSTREGSGIRIPAANSGQGGGYNGQAGGSGFVRVTWFEWYLK